MTCIFGLEDSGVIYIGSDSGSTYGWQVRSLKQPKVFRAGPFLIGHTTSFRMGQLLRFELNVSDQNGKSDMKYMVVDFVSAVRALFTGGGFATITDSRELGGEFLVGYNGRLYGVGNDFAVLQYRENFHSIGSGAEYALGAFKAMTNQLPGEKKILAALKISAHFSGSVMGPFKVMKL